MSMLLFVSTFSSDSHLILCLLSVIIVILLGLQVFEGAVESGGGGEIGSKVRSAGNERGGQGSVSTTHLRSHTIDALVPLPHAVAFVF